VFAIVPVLIDSSMCNKLKDASGIYLSQYIYIYIYHINNTLCVSIYLSIGTAAEFIEEALPTSPCYTEYQFETYTRYLYLYLHLYLYLYLHHVSLQNTNLKLITLYLSLYLSNLKLTLDIVLQLFQLVKMTQKMKVFI
jgi:hypothetical protein